MDIDLENGGGNNDVDAAVVSRSPDPVDPQPPMRELPPFTWLRAAPYTVAVLAGVALVAVGVALICRSCSAAGGAAHDEKKPARNTFVGGCADLGYMVALGGGVLIFMAAFLASALLNRDCRVPRLDQDDD